MGWLGDGHWAGYLHYGEKKINKIIGGGITSSKKAFLVSLNWLFSSMLETPGCLLCTFMEFTLLCLEWNILPSQINEQ